MKTDPLKAALEEMEHACEQVRERNAEYFTYFKDGKVEGLSKAISILRKHQKQKGKLPARKQEKR